MLDLRPIASFTVKLSAGTKTEIQKSDADLVKALAPGNFPGQEAAMADVGKFVAQLTDPQKRMLLDALRHCNGPNHNDEVSFSAQQVGYKLGGIQFSVRDETWTESQPGQPAQIKPLAVSFAYGAQS